jgi:hypothetical protein
MTSLRERLQGLREIVENLADAIPVDDPSNLGQALHPGSIRFLPQNSEPEIASKTDEPELTERAVGE